MVNIYATNDTIRNRTLFKNVEDRICRLFRSFQKLRFNVEVILIQYLMITWIDGLQNLQT